MKNLYVSVMALQLALAVIAAAMGFAGNVLLAISFASISLALVPVLAHLRMRRLVATLGKKLNAIDSKLLNVFDSKLEATNAKIAELESKLGELKELVERQNVEEEENGHDGFGDFSSAKVVANQLRREVRALRLSIREAVEESGGNVLGADRPGMAEK